MKKEYKIPEIVQEDEMLFTKEVWEDFRPCLKNRYCTNDKEV